MNRTILCALALAGFAASANAADLSVGSLKDPLPDTLSWHGVTIYGTVDVGYGYQSHGAPGNGDFRQGFDYNIYSSKFANRSFSALESQALEQSKIGVKIEESIGGGWAAVGRLDTSFNPLTGTGVNGLHSLIANAGTPLTQQTANGDSGRAGQIFNGVAYGGISNASYGTLTFGRQTSLQGDAFAGYDPQGQSNAFGLLGWSSALSGAGITEASTLDNSLKYVFQYGSVHVAGQYAEGGPDTGFFGSAWGANVGGTYKGFSLDGVYSKVNAGAMATANSSTTGKAMDQAPTTNANSFTSLKAQIADGESWSVQGKYTFDLGGGFKDDEPGAKVTLFGGYENISMDNSSVARSTSYAGQTIAGGYLIGAASTSTYDTARVLQVEWGGVKYELPSGWSFTGAYYHLDQNHYQGATTAAQAGSPNKQAGNLAGGLNDGSFVADYRFNKHFDVYAGVNYSAIDGGLASGYLANNDTSFVTGVRLKF
jgi:predicted porin